MIAMLVRIFGNNKVFLVLLVIEIEIYGNCLREPLLLLLFSIIIGSIIITKVIFFYFFSPF